MCDEQQKNRSSRLPGFHRFTVSERRAELRRWIGAGALEAVVDGGMNDELADKLVENAVGAFSLPLGVAPNFLINGKPYLVPMAIEEPSVIAAASNAARQIHLGGGFTADPIPAETTVQIELLGKVDAAALSAHQAALMAVANETQPQLVALGGGVRTVEIRSSVGECARTVVHLVVDCRDAMGANMVNTMAEAVAPYLVRITGADVGLRILTNLADRRLARVRCKIPFAHLARKSFSGLQVAKGVVNASRFASADPYRAATHNKGIFNGIDAVLLACGNDWRAVEAGGHAYAAQSGSYQPLATWTIDEDQLVGRLEMPMAVGIVGGAAKAHPTAQAAIELLGVVSAEELGQVAACTGLATNLAALSALATEGIQTGHMRLHRKRLDAHRQ